MSQMVVILPIIVNPQIITMGFQGTAVEVTHLVVVKGKIVKRNALLLEIIW